MTKPEVTVEDLLLRRLVQDKLDKIKGDASQLMGAAEVLADSLIQARAAVKWLVRQNAGLSRPEKQETYERIDEP